MTGAAAATGLFRHHRPTAAITPRVATAARSVGADIR